MHGRLDFSTNRLTRDCCLGPQKHKQFHNRNKYRICHPPPPSYLDGQGRPSQINYPNTYYTVNDWNIFSDNYWSNTWTNFCIKTKFSEIWKQNTTLSVPSTLSFVLSEQISHKDYNKRHVDSQVVTCCALNIVTKHRRYIIQMSHATRHTFILVTEFSYSLFVWEKLVT